MLDAYALYLSKFVTAYKAHSIPVTAMMVQNEPYAGGCNYPKCEWTGVQMRDFILEHAGPRFATDHGDATKMWLGTLNTFDFLECPNTVLSDIAAKGMIGGAALQYAGKGMVERVAKTWPDLPLIQSESECGKHLCFVSNARRVGASVRGGTARPQPPGTGAPLSSGARGQVGAPSVPLSSSY